MFKLTVIAIISIIIIMSSSITISNPYYTSNIVQKQTTNFESAKIIPQPKHHQISISDDISKDLSIGPGDSKPINQSPKNTHRPISISDDIGLTDASPNKNTIMIIKQIPVVQAILERISNSERQKFFVKQSNTYSIQQLSDHYKSTSSEFLTKDSINEFPLDTNKFENPVFYDTQLENILKDSNVIKKILLINFDQDNSLIILLFVPFVGYALVLVDTERFKIKSNRIFSFCFIILLTASVVTTPISLSSNYGALASAQEENATKPNVQFNFSNGTSIGNFSNILNTNSSNQINKSSIQTFSNDTNSKSNLSAQSQITLSDNASVILNQSHTPLLSSNVEMSDSINASLNGTIPEQKSAFLDQQTISDLVLLNVTNTTPKPEKSWTFNSTQNIIGNAKITNNTTLNLEGSGYVADKINKTDVLKELTLSAWVEPDYTQGSPVFTIISKENQFTLSINNNVQPKNIAQFSIFDGIKWNTVNSTMPILGWTHLAATYNGTDIAIFVNGTKQSSLHLTGIPMLTNNGQLQPQITNLTSNSDVIIGASVNSLRGNHPKDSFSGKIKYVNLYTTLLDPYQINQLYLQYAQSMESLSSNLISPDDNISISDNIQTSLQSPIQNRTVSEEELNPELNSTKKSYVITESPVIQFNYLNDSQILKNAQKEITTELAKIDQVEKTLNKTEVLINSTNIDSKTVAEINYTQKNINYAQQQINQVQHEANQIQQAANITKTSVSTKQIQNILNQTIQTQSQIQQTESMINNTGKQLQNFANQISPNQNITSSVQQIVINSSNLNNNTQSGSWTDSNKTITVKVLDSDGKQVENQPLIRQITDGKFDIVIPTTEKPGIYTVETTLVKDGKTFTNEEQFAWGLISLNTQKSIYRPGEVANMTIVVLNNKGHPVCDASVTMDVIDPNQHLTTLSTGNGIAPNSQCGLYYTQYNTTIPGNYTVNVSATADSIKTDFTTHFLAQNIYPFDIIRTTQSKIDPINNPNSFNVKIDITSFTDVNSLIIKESIPSTFNVTTDGDVQTVGNSKVITWNKDLIKNRISLDYSYSVPLQFPRLYILGPIEIDYGNNQTFTEARPWFVANDPITNFTPNVSDTLSLSEKAKTSIPVKEILSLGISGSLTNKISTSDTLSLSEKTQTSIPVKEILSITDLGNAANHQFKPISTSDTIALTDSGVAHAGRLLSPSDAIALSESGTTTNNQFKPISTSDTIALTDSGVTHAGRLLSPSDAIALSESGTTTNNQFKPISTSDTLPLSEKTQTSIPIKEILSISESGNPTPSQFQPITTSDVLSLSEKIAKSIPVNEILPINEKIKTSIPVNEVLSLGISGGLTSKISASDIFTLADSNSRIANYVRQISDGMNSTDSLIGSDNHNTSLSDSLTIAESITKSTIKSLMDSVSLFSSSTGINNLKPTQQLVENAQKSVQVVPSTPELVIVSSNASLSNVIVPSTADATLNYTKIIQTSGSTSTVSITNGLTITKDVNGDSQPEVKITIPDGSNIEGTSWNGILHLPTIQSSTNLNLPVPTGQIATPQIVINVGSSTPLTFNQPVRVLLTGQAGTLAGFFYNPSAVTEITSVCTSDSISGIPSGANECKINVGSDLAIWTNHFTSFTTWTTSTAPVSTPNTGTGGGGGGGFGTGMGPGNTGPNGGGLGPYLKIEDISYDTCDKQIVRIQVGTSVKEIDPYVIVRTSLTGVVNAKLIQDQPYAQENANALVRKLVYEAAISPKENSFEVLALESAGHGIFSEGKTIDVTECKGEISYLTNSTTIPNWVKKVGGYWSQGEISDGEFINALQYLINNGIMTVPSTQSVPETSNVIPTWVKENAGYWANGTISNNEFVQGIQYLISHGIIQIS